MKRILALLIALLVGSPLALAQEEPKPAEPQPKVPEDAPEGQPKEPTAADLPAAKFKVVTINDIKLADEARKRELALLILAPEEEGKFPVILLSAAMGQQPGSLGALARSWASQGYVVVIPTHADAAAPGRAPAGRAVDVDQLFERLDADKDGKLSEAEMADLPEALKTRLKAADTDGDGSVSKEEATKAFGAQPAPERPAPPPPGPRKEEEFSPGHLLDEPVQRQPRNPGRQPVAQESIEAALDRVKDFVLVLDALASLGEKSVALKGKIDTEKVAVAGVALGAYTAGLLAGATVDVAADKLAQSFADKRVKALIEISPHGTGALGLGKESWKGVKTPMLMLTGSNDRVGRGEGARGVEWRREGFDNAAAGDKFLVVIEGAGRGSLLGSGVGMRSPRGNEEQVEAQRLMFQWSQAATLHFLNHTLKADAASAKLLNAEAFKAATGGKVALEKK